MNGGHEIGGCPLPSGRRAGFWESYKSEIAAHELDRLLGLDMVPPTVDAGNILVDPLWNMILIDHARAFFNDTMPFEKQMTHVDRPLFDELKALDEATAMARLKPWLLSESMVRQLPKRRDRIVAHFEARAKAGRGPGVRSVTEPGGGVHPSRGRRPAAGTMAAALGLAASLSAGKPAAAGPPFQTDDPEPVPFHHYEAYAFGVLDRGGGSTFLQAPAFEFNVGAAPNLQLHVVVPMAYQTPGHQFGVGDVELGAKYRFVQESARRPQIATFPMLELPTGDGERGLGNGRLWARLPVWLQKSYGPWTTFGGVGYEVNDAPAMKDSVFAGWLLQRRLEKRLTLGAEVFSQQAREVGGRGTTFVDAGGYLDFRENLSLLFMLGHTVAGESHAVGYLGLYYTWGRDRSP